MDKNSVRLIIQKVYEEGQYHKLAKSNEKYKQKDIDQALASIKHLIMESLPNRSLDEYYFSRQITHADEELKRTQAISMRLGYNEALQDCLTIIKELK